MNSPTGAHRDPFPAGGRRDSHGRTRQPLKRMYLRNEDPSPEVCPWGSFGGPRTAHAAAFTK
jgi:hypothetical protein